jgi:hypothetical protein
MSKALARLEDAKLRIEGKSAVGRFFPCLPIGRIKHETPSRGRRSADSIRQQSARPFPAPYR